MNGLLLTARPGFAVESYTLTTSGNFRLRVSRKHRLRRQKNKFIVNFADGTRRTIWLRRRMTMDDLMDRLRSMGIDATEARGE